MRKNFMTKMISKWWQWTLEIRLVFMRWVAKPVICTLNLWTRGVRWTVMAVWTEYNVLHFWHLREKFSMSWTVNKYPVFNHSDELKYEQRMWKLNSTKWKAQCVACAHQFFEILVAQYWVYAGAVRKGTDTVACPVSKEVKQMRSVSVSVTTTVKWIYVFSQCFERMVQWWKGGTQSPIDAL